jgi:hypothetical protein
MSGDLCRALRAVDWGANIDALCNDAASATELDRLISRFSLWAGQLSAVELDNEAIRFIHEAQLHTHFTCALIALGLYKPAAASMRAFIECTLYYTYFRSHPAELATLVRDSNYYLQRAEIVEFHKTHTPHFVAKDKAVGLTARLSSWYSTVSAIVHGQVPGEWIASEDLRKSRQVPALTAKAVTKLGEAIAIADGLLFCTITEDMWTSFSVGAKRTLVRGMPGPTKVALGLSVA